MSRFYIDMDGVVAKFHPEKSIEEIMEPGYFLNLEPVIQVINAIERLVASGKEVYILSSVFNMEKALEKRNWGQKYLPFIKSDNYIFVPYEKKKSDYIENISSKDILLDDFSKNLFEWEGTAIKLLNGINHTKGTWTGFAVNGNGDAQMIYKTLLGISLVCEMEE